MPSHSPLPSRPFALGVALGGPHRLARRMVAHRPTRPELAAALAAFGVLTALWKLPTHYRAWVPPMLPWAAGLGVFAAAAVLAVGLDRLPGIPRTRRDALAVVVPLLGLGFRFAVGFVVLGLVLRAAGLHPTLWRAFSDGGALVRVWALVLIAGFASGATAGHWLRRAAASLRPGT